MENMHILLLGGNGFLGRGLQDELAARNISFKSVDKEDYDLINYANMSKCVADLKNTTHVVILASKLGIDLFNVNPVPASEYNASIHKFTLDAIVAASKLYKKPYDVTYYSTSEVYGSLENKYDVITERAPYNFIENSRYLYSYVKYKAESDYFKLNYEHPEIVSNVKIVHPFNVYGKNLKRGVAYSMLKSALEDNVIYYNEDTTRTMTSLKLASKMSTDALLSKENMHMNAADSRCSLTMKSLAEIVKSIVGNQDIKLIELPPDKFVLYRHVSKPDADVHLAEEVMREELLELLHLLT